MQFRRFKAARKEAINSDVITIHIDWSENVSMTKSREEKSAYYNDAQISIHVMYAWCGSSKFAIV